MLRLQPVKVATTSADHEGMLIFSGDFLVAVLVRLEEHVHGAHYGGKWNLEATFDGLPFPPDEVFDDLDDAQTWIETSLGKSIWEQN